MAPGNRFLAELMGLQSSETSAQSTEESGHVPLLNSPPFSPSPQAARRPSETKPKGSLSSPLLPHPVAIATATLNRSVTTMPRKSPTLFVTSYKKHRARKDGSRLQNFC